MKKGLGVVSGFFLESVKTTDAGGNNHTHAVAVKTIAFGFQSGVGHGLAGRYHGILGIEVELACFATVEVLLGVEVLHLASEACLEQGGVEMGDRASAAYTVLGVLPGGGHVVADGGDGAKACNYDSFKFHSGEISLYGYRQVLLMAGGICKKPPFFQ